MRFGVPDTGAGPVGGTAARRAARDELAKREYRTDQGSNPLTKALRWLGDRIGDLTSGAGGSHAILLLGALLLVVAIVVVARVGVPRRRGPQGPDIGTDPLAPVSARDHRQLAEQMTAAGNHREALREWLRTAIATVEERGILPPRPGRTGAATAREAGPLVPAAAEYLRAATIAFDEVWFGGRPATTNDVDHARAAADAVARARMTAPDTPGAPDGLAVPG